MKVINRLVLLYLFCFISFICVNGIIKGIETHEEIKNGIDMESVQQAQLEMLRECTADMEKGLLYCD